jgi:very-short-patch-repair endonuclease
MCSPRHKLIIELDGGQHLEQAEYDHERTLYLASKGYRVLRFWNNEVLQDLNGVVTTILNALEQSGASGLK